MPSPLLFEHPTDIILLVDPDTREIVRMSKNAHALLGSNENNIEKLLGNKLDLKELKKCNYQVLGDSLGYNWSAQTFFYDDLNCWLVRGIPKMLQSVEEAEQKYRQLFDKSSDAILIMNQDKIVDCNKRTSEMFGFTYDEILDLKPMDFKGGMIREEFNDIDLFTHKFTQAISGEAQRAKMICHRHDNSTFHAEIKLSSFQLASGEYVQLIIRDISERVIYEAAIRESEERFRLLSKVAIEGVVFLRDNIIVDCNEQMGQLLIQGPRKNLIGKDATEFFLRDDLSRIESILELESNNKSEIRCVNKMGESLILETSASHITYRGEQVMVLLCYDISSRKRAEQALEQSSERFKNLVENSPNAVFILTDGQIKYSNSSGIQLLGFDEEDELYDRPFLEFFEDEFKKVVSRDLERIREGKEVDYKEVQIKDNQGKVVDVGVKVTLTVYDRRPSIQATVNNLSTRMLLLQEQVRAQLAEEINAVLKQEIEEHKVTQRKLIETQNFTRNIIESSIDMIIAVDKKYKVTEFNSAAVRQFGYSASEMLGKPVHKLFKSKAEFKKISDFLESEGTFVGEIENKTADNKMFTALLSASLIKTPDGEIVGSMGVSRDITEIKKAEQELIESEERYRDIFENASDFILSVDNKGKFIYANKSFMKTLGYSVNELKKKTIYDLIGSSCDKSVKEMLTKEENHDLIIHFESKKGETIISEGESSIRYKDDKKHSIRVILRDVTETKKQEMEVLQQKAKLESIFESTENMMIWTMDKDFIVTSCNRNFTEVSEQMMDVRVVEGMNYMNLLKENVYEKLYQGQLSYFEKAFNGKPMQFELPLDNKMDGPTWLQVFLNPIYVDGKMTEISCLSYDITDRIQINRKIRDSLKEKEVLLQEVHHRVKNNMQVISSILNLQSSYVEDEKTQEILRESQDRIKSMSIIHESLYQNADISKIEFTDYIDALARSLITSYALPSRAVEFIPEYDAISLSLDQAIPCGLIVNELITNAMKYAFEGIQEPKLNLSVKLKKKKIEILVADNGIGLPEGFRYQDSDSLGIQLVYSLVEQLDGSLKVESKGGTSFLITFGHI